MLQGSKHNQHSMTAIAKRPTSSDLYMKKRQTSEKNYQDLNKSIANLARAPEILSSFPDPLEQEDTLQHSSSALGPKISKFQFQPILKSLQKDNKFIRHSNEQKNDAMRAFKSSSINTLKNSNQNSTVSIEESSKYKEHRNPFQLVLGRLQGKKHSNIIVSNNRILNNPVQKPLFTEGDSPTGEKDFSNYRFCEEFSRPVEWIKIKKQNAEQIENGDVQKKLNIFNKDIIYQKHQNIKTEGDAEYYNDYYEEKSSIFTPSFKCYEDFIKLNLEGRVNIFASLNIELEHKISKFGKIKKDSLIFIDDRRQEAQEILSLNNISDGVKYGAGGKGYNERVGRDRKKEDKIISKSADKMCIVNQFDTAKRKGRSTEKVARVVSVQKGTLNGWKREIDEVNLIKITAF